MERLSEASKKEAFIIKSIEANLVRGFQNVRLSSPSARCSTPAPVEEEATSLEKLDENSSYLNFCVFLKLSPLESKFRGTFKPKGFIGGHLVMERPRSNISIKNISAQMCYHSSIKYIKDKADSIRRKYMNNDKLNVRIIEK
ncbi:unnamed protein product [Phyllotreta striolata]|uniref:Uncharacterized protein n=1 Tax=Phyllotreta striolata TaxID=444603 RepID=A0A9N9TU97_PHYSR|nr:unnamed protein product [Phyllotreta striolata]